jgi:hypothetical protein
MAFKQADDFLRFITMGAAGSATVAQFLNEEHGHRLVELERYAMANKLWATKIKRLRLADLVCLDCGLRVEARAKSALAIRMSHSDTAGRQWDAGLRDEDICAFVAWDHDAGAPAERPECFTVSAMRRAFGHARLGPRKSASEGAERDVTWPASVPKRDGVVEGVDHDEGKVRFRPFEGSRQTYYLRDPGLPTYIYVESGDQLHGGERFAVGCVEPPADLGCPAKEWPYAVDFGSVDPVERYVAVKVAGALVDASAEEPLLAIAKNNDEDERVRLEAWGSLARIDPDRYTREAFARARQRTPGDRQAMAMAMEAIFILSELGTSAAADALTGLAADTTLDSEARSAAVWGLGVAGVNDPSAVLPFIADSDEDVALHALAGIGRLSKDSLAEVQAMLDGTDREAASATALLVPFSAPRWGSAG